MNKLDNPKLVAKLDPAGALKSIGLLGEQVSQVWREFKKVKLPKSYKKINSIVINGMGGSALGAHILGELFFDQLKVPFRVINSYLLPAAVDQKTLYIICSYSGSTEEPLLAFSEAQKRGAKIFGIAAGKNLGQLIKRGKMPGYIFEPKANPSKQPRLGLGYTLGAELALLKKLGLIKLADSDLKSSLKNLDGFNRIFGFANPAAKNPAKKLASAIHGNAIVVVASEHLSGNAHVFANQLNETSKTFAAYYLISELNHHLLEGLANPASNRQSLMFIFLESDLYFAKNQRRYAITEKIVQKNKVKSISYQVKGKSKLAQVWECLALSSYATFYLALLNNVNPNLIPWVDLFKAELKKKK